MPTTPSPREKTRDELLRLIRTGGGMTRADLARSSGMSRSAVNGAVAGLLADARVTDVAIADTFGKIVGDRRVEIDVDLAATEAMDAASDLLEELRRELGLDRVEAVVAGIPGPVDVRTGLVQSPTILSGWVGRS